MKVWYLPLEPLDERYTRLMLNWVTEAMDDLRMDLSMDYEVIFGDQRTEKIRTGEWLDVYDTSAWKASQLSRLMARMDEVEDGDVVLLGDVWFPGIESIAFVNELAGRRIKVAGWHYAGCFDRHDLLAKKLTRWGPAFERLLFDGVLDGVCYGSKFHRDFVVKAVGRNERRKDMPFGLAWDSETVRQMAGDSLGAPRQQTVVFPHRWADEKRPWAFCELAKRYAGEWKFVFSTSGDRPVPVPSGSKVEVVRHKSKTDYYRFLATAGVVYSAADQETFGYSFHEAIALETPVVAPKRCSYAEPFIGQPASVYLSHLYEDADDALGADKLKRQMDNPTPAPLEVTKAYDGSHKRFLHHIATELS